MPESGEHRLKPGPEGVLPDQKARKHADQIHRPDISPADSERNVQKSPYGSQGKYHIRKDPVPVSRGTEKTVKQPKTASQ